MAIRMKLSPCFGSLKCTKMELIMETILSRGPLWQNIHYVECKSNGEIIVGQDGQPLCQELEVSLCPPGGKLEYMPTDTGHLLPLTLVACHQRWDDFQDLGETVAEMSQRLIDEDGQLALPPNDDTVFMSKLEFPGGLYGLGTRENPINLSDTPTKVSHTAT